MAVARKSEETNPFFVEDDEDDHWSYRNKVKNQFDDEDSTLEQLVARKEASEKRQIESLNRALNMVHESEDIGCKTAEELVHQGEQLNNVENNLKSVEAMTKVTQRHLNSIKSVFGGIKNWFQAKSDQTPAKSEIQHSRLKETLHDYGESKSSKTRSSHPHKGSRLYNESDDDDDNFRDMSTSASSHSMVDSRLDMLSEGLSRLKGLGHGMNDELNRQNDQLLRLNDLAEKNDEILKDQTRQTKAMLR